ncbi:MAG: methyltransferase [Nanoarchaeota archaeon]
MTTYYFSKEQNSELNLKKIKANILSENFEFYVGSGVFSKSKIDKGTEVLLNSVFIKPEWKILDLGCGYGAIGIILKKVYPDAIVTMVDINKRALKLAKMNVNLNNVDVRVMESDLYAKVQTQFDTIVVNPPQKAGKQLCFKIIEDAKEHLKDKGLLQLVGRHNKGGKTLEKKMLSVFGNVKSASKKSGYRVYVSEK